MYVLRTVALAIVLSCAAVHSAFAGDYPFGRVVRAENTEFKTRWLIASERTKNDVERWQFCKLNSSEDFCVLNASELKKFDSLVNIVRSKQGTAALDALHREVKRTVHYASDTYRFGGDRWSSAFDTLAEDLGDCEDYALLEYAVLIAAKFDAASLGLVFLESKRTRDGGHIVLAIRFPGGWRFLDSMVDTTLMELVGKESVTQEKDILPFFVPHAFFDKSGIWEYVPLKPMLSAR